MRWHAVALLEGLAGCTALLAACWVVGCAIAPRGSGAARLAVGSMSVLAVGWLLLAQPLIGFSVLGRPWLLAGVLVALLAVAGWVARRRLRPERVRPVPIAVAAGLVVLTSWPVIRTPTDRVGGGDMLWHLGWIRQLIGGRPEPSSLYSGIPSGYPWLYHALAAGMAQTLPGGVSVVLLVLQLFGVTTMALGVWLLARELSLSETASTWAMVIAVGGGGLGWLWTRSAAGEPIVNATNLGKYGGDLVLSPAPTPALGNIPPLLPRELGVALIPIALWAALVALRSGRRGLEAAAGGMCAIVILVAPLAGLYCVAAVVALAFALRRWPILVLAACAAGTLIWLAPLAVDIGRFGSLINTSVVAPVSPTTAQVLVELGVMLPLAVGGVVVGRRSLDAGSRRPACALLVMTAAALAIALVINGGGAPGSQAFGRGLRYLPFAALGLAFPAALAVEWLISRSGRFAVVTTAVAGVIVLASATQASLWRADDLAGRVDNTALSCLARTSIGQSDTIAAAGPKAFALRAFSLTGATVLYRARPRVRFRDAFEHVPTQGQRLAWQRAIDRGVQPPGLVTWVVEPKPRGGIPDWGSQPQPCRFAGHRYVAFRNRLAG